MKTHFSATVIILFLLQACNTEKPAQSAAIITTEQLTATAVNEVPADVRTYCYPCHNPAAPSHDAIIAPPLAAVQFRYKMNYPDKKQFVEKMTDFLLDPKKEKAIMYGAVTRFGIMAKPAADEQSIKAIVEYIHSGNLEKPAWYNDRMSH